MRGQKELFTQGCEAGKGSYLGMNEDARILEKMYLIKW